MPTTLRIPVVSHEWNARWFGAELVLSQCALEHSPWYVRSFGGMQAVQPAAGSHCPFKHDGSHSLHCVAPGSAKKPSWHSARGTALVSCPKLIFRRTRVA